MAYKYFLYSKDYIDEQNSILSKKGKTFIPGTVAVGGSKKQFAKLSSTDTIPRFIDTKVVAEGEETTIRFEKPKIERISL